MNRLHGQNTNEIRNGGLYNDNNEKKKEVKSLMSQFINLINEVIG